VRRYGPKQVEESATHCVAQVNKGRYARQCWRPRSSGPDGLYCRYHAKSILAGKHVYTPKDEKE